MGNVADNHLATMIRLFSKLKGWAFADKVFINQKAVEQLLTQGLHLVTGIRQNMKNRLMLMEQKLLLKKRGIIESVNDILKRQYVTLNIQDTEVPLMRSLIYMQGCVAILF